MVGKEIFKRLRDFSLKSSVIVRFEVLDKHVFATLNAQPLNRVLNAAARNLAQVQCVQAFNWGRRGSLWGDRESTISLTSQTFFLARRRVFVFFRRPFFFRSGKEHFATHRCFCVLRKHSSTAAITIVLCLQLVIFALALITTLSLAGK